MSSDTENVETDEAPSQLPGRDGKKRPFSVEIASPTEPSTLIFRATSKTKTKKKSGLSKLYDQLLMSVIRPPRAEYQASELGPKLITMHGKRMERSDFGITNNRGETLACSIWSPEAAAVHNCILYCHSNSSCRLAAVRTPVLETVAKLKAAALIIFDFAGCGISTGKYVTLGIRERDDVAAVVKWSASKYPNAKIILWGRSMGAVSALLYHYDANTKDMEESQGRMDETTRALPREIDTTTTHQSLQSHFTSSSSSSQQVTPQKAGQKIVGLILDSPFSSMKQLVADVSRTALPRVPSCCIGCVVASLRRNVKKKTEGCDVLRISAMEAAQSATKPALFIAASNDRLAPPATHTDKLRKHYGAVSSSISFEGQHNSPRPALVYDAVLNFCKPLLEDSSSVHTTESPLPPFWNEAKDQSTGEAYYINMKTSEVSWLRPVYSRQVETPAETPKKNGAAPTLKASS